MENKINGNLTNESLQNTVKQDLTNKSSDSLDINIPSFSNTEENNLEKTELNVDQKIENKNQDNINKIKEDVHTTNKSNSSIVDDEKSHMNEIDLEMEKHIEKILNDDLFNIYESLSDQEKENFKKNQHEVSIKIIVSIKSAAGNIKKAIKTIFTLIYKWMNSMKGIKNKAFIEKSTKLKVEKILQSQENNNLNKK